MRSFPGVARERFLADHNRLLIGVLLTLRRRRVVDCESPKRFENIQSRCFQKLSSDAKQAENTYSDELYGADPVFLASSSLFDENATVAEYYGTRCPKCNNVGIPHAFEAQGLNGSKTYPVLFDINLSAKRAALLMEHLVEGFYLDAHAALLRIQLVTYNAQLSLFGMVNVELNFDDSGLILMNRKVTTFEALNDKANLTDDDIFLHNLWSAFLGLLCVDIALELISMLRSPRLYFKNPLWNLLDTLNILVFAAIYLKNTSNDEFLRTVFRPVMRVDLYSEMNSKKAALLHVTGEEREARYRTLLKLFDEIAIHIDGQSTYAALNSVACLFMVFRLLKLLDFQKRVGLVTRTIARAGSDLAHFAALFVFILGVYVLLGHFIFGNASEDFSTLVRSWTPVGLCAVFFCFVWSVEMRKD